MQNDILPDIQKPILSIQRVLQLLSLQEWSQIGILHIIESVLIHEMHCIFGTTVEVIIRQVKSMRNDI